MSRNSFLERMSAGVESYRGLNISMEEAEADAMAAEAEIEGAEITEDLATANRAVEVSDGLEDIAAIAEQTIGDNDATESEAALINAAANMAVAGTDDDAEALVPAVESRQRVGVESIRQRAADIWRSIVEFIKKIWAKMESWIYKLFGNAPKLRKRVESMRKRAENAATLSVKDAKTMSVTSGLRSLTLNGKVIKSGSELVNGMKVAETVGKTTLSELQQKVKSFGDQLYSAYDSFDVEKTSLFIGGVLKAAKDIAPSGWGSDEAKRWDANEFATSRSPELLGNRCVLVRVPVKKENDGRSALGSLDVARRTATMMGSYTNKDVTLPNEASVTTFSLGEIEAVCKHIMGFADQIEEYSRGKVFKDLKSTKDKIEKASSKVAADWDRKVNETGEDGEKVIKAEHAAVMKSALSLNLTFLNLVKEPGSSMVSYLVGLSYAALALCDKSLSQYK